ncbi:Mth938-like domain-containing protein [Paenalcaligenes niemegkensis]|uniref:Mth938-like domain-containing protein n=1 Tax=Paenalcaligenes niemegkensis TaxID=2895469 RepID=UPI001EE952DD|nr:Mth938-like domain-containing protein [Paenalcaligenes niemegkensis]MCQ9615637.1 Mth938-like domain-containing protein [Paenalcaligenes niemegkensis]
MQLQKENNPALNTITAYDVDYVEVNREKYHSSIFFRPEGIVELLAARSAADINEALLQKITGLDQIKQDPMDFLDGNTPVLPQDAPEVVLIGTGETQQLLSPQVTSSLLGMRIGIEVMDTRAAARTYNILMSEGRKVVAALLI